MPSQLLPGLLESTLVIGSVYYLELLYRDSNGDPHDFSSDDIEWKATNTITKAEIFNFDQTDPEITRGSDGTLSIEIPAAVTENYDFHRAEWKVFVDPTGSEDKFCLIQGPLKREG